MSDTNERMPVRLASKAPNLFQIAAAGHAANPDGGPPQLGHQLCQAPVRARPPVTLGDFQYVTRGLYRHAFQAVVADLTLQPFQPLWCDPR
jgi:hypothetical protein